MLLEVLQRTGQSLKHRLSSSNVSSGEIGNPGLSSASKHSGFVSVGNRQLYLAHLHGNKPQHRGASLIKW